MRSWNIIKKRVVLVPLLLFSLNINAQHFYDSGRVDLASNYFRYNPYTNHYELVTMSFDGLGKFDTTLVFHRLTIDRQLKTSSIDTLNVPDAGIYQYTQPIGIDSINDLLIMRRISPDKSVHFIGHYLEGLDLCRITPDSITHWVKLTPDSAYGVFVNAQWMEKGNDTLYVLAQFSLGAKDSNQAQHLIKVDTTAGQVIDKQLDLFYNGARITLGTAPGRDSKGNLVFVAGALTTNPTTVGTTVVKVSNNFDTVFNKYNLSGIGSTYHNLWVHNDKAIVFLRGVRQDLNFSPSLFYELSLEVFDLKKDTLIKRHYFTLTPQNPDGYALDISGPAAYFDGEHFVLPATLNTNPSGLRRYAFMMLGVDTNYQIINKTVIMDSTINFFAAVRGILPEPDSSGNFIYSGAIEGTTIPPSGGVDIFWSRFKFPKPGIGLDTYLREEAAINIFPNPTSDNITICIKEGSQKEYVIKIYSMAGKLVGTAVLKEQCLELNLGLEPGTYIVECKSQGVSEHQHLIVR